ncbi:MAG: hypothetical protein GXO21_05590 [Aquificae bacterium]|nr:hypothetical protein [Aquificota bacterium]
MDLKEKIFSFLKEKNLPVKTGEISNNLNIDRNTVQKILNELSLENKIKLDRCFNKVLYVEKGGDNGR